MDKDQEIEALADHAWITVEINCSECPEIQLDYTPNIHIACNRFYLMGWRVLKEEALCPECIEKQK